MPSPPTGDDKADGPVRSGKRNPRKLGCTALNAKHLVCI